MLSSPPGQESSPPGKEKETYTSIERAARRRALYVAAAAALAPWDARASARTRRRAHLSRACKTAAACPGRTVAAAARATAPSCAGVILDALARLTSAAGTGRAVRLWREHRANTRLWIAYTIVLTRILRRAIHLRPCGARACLARID